MVEGRRVGLRTRDEIELLEGGTHIRIGPDTAVENVLLSAGDRSGG